MLKKFGINFPNPFPFVAVKAGTEAEIIAALDEAAQEGTWGYVPLSGPYIDKQMSKNVTGQIGKTAVLSCRILYIVGKTVSFCLIKFMSPANRQTDRQVDSQT